MLPNIVMCWCLPYGALRLFAPLLNDYFLTASEVFCTAKTAVAKSLDTCDNQSKRSCTFQLVLQENNFDRVVFVITE
jgi:hypothetical protein